MIDTKTYFENSTTIYKTKSQLKDQLGKSIFKLGYINNGVYQQTKGQLWVDKYLKNGKFKSAGLDNFSCYNIEATEYRTYKIRKIQHIITADAYYAPIDARDIKSGEIMFTKLPIKKRDYT